MNNKEKTLGINEIKEIKKNLQKLKINLISQNKRISELSTKDFRVKATAFYLAMILLIPSFDKKVRKIINSPILNESYLKIIFLDDLDYYIHKNSLNSISIELIKEILQSKNCLTEEEINLLCNQDLLEDIIPYYEESPMQTYIYKKINSLYVNYVSPEVISLLNKEAAGLTFTITNKIYIDSSYEEKERYEILTHEFTHILQNMDEITYIHEAVAELIREEYYGIASTAYEKQQENLKVLMGIVGSKIVWEANFKSSQSLISILKDNLSEEDYKEILRIYSLHSISPKDKDHEKVLEIYLRLAKSYLNKDEYEEFISKYNNGLFFRKDVKYFNQRNNILSSNKYGKSKFISEVVELKDEEGKSIYIDLETYNQILNGTYKIERPIEEVLTPIQKQQQENYILSAEEFMYSLKDYQLVDNLYEFLNYTGEIVYIKKSLTPISFIKSYIKLEKEVNGIIDIKIIERNLYQALIGNYYKELYGKDEYEKNKYLCSYKVTNKYYLIETPVGKRLVTSIEFLEYLNTQQKEMLGIIAPIEIFDYTLPKNIINIQNQESSLKRIKK